MSSTCSGSGIACAISRARANSVAASPNGRAPQAAPGIAARPRTTGRAPRYRPAHQSGRDPGRGRGPVRSRPIPRVPRLRNRGTWSGRRAPAAAGRGGPGSRPRPGRPRSWPRRSARAPGRTPAGTARASTPGRRAGRDPAITVGHATGASAAPSLKSPAADPDARGRVRRPRCRAHVSRWSDGPAAPYPPPMSELSIRVGDLHFSARWEPEAPRTIEIVRAMLPLRARLIHCRWSGESTWIPYGDLRRTWAGSITRRTPRPGTSRCTRAASASARSSSRTAPARHRRRSGSWPPTTSPPSSPTTAGRTGCARSAAGASGTGHRTIEISEGLTMADLVVRGGTVVTANGSRVADVAVDGGRISAVEPDLGGPAATAGEVVDATGLLVLPGIVDVHTHTRVAIGRRAGPVLRRFGRCGLRGHDDLPGVQQPGHGIVAAAAAVAASPGSASGGRRPTGDAAVDIGPQPGHHRRPGRTRSRSIPAVIEAGVATVKVFIVYEFGVDDATLLRALAAAGTHGRPARGPRREPGHARGGHRARARGRAGRAAVPRGSRPPYVEAEATTRAIEVAAKPRTRRCTSSTCPRPRRWPRSRRARAPGQAVYAETCPHYLSLTTTGYDAPAEVAARVRHLAAAARRRRSRGPLDGLADGIAGPRGDRPCAGPPGRREASGASPSTGSRTAAPGIETLLPVVYDEGVAAGRIDVERLVDLLATTPARLFGLRRQGCDRGRTRRRPRAPRSRTRGGRSGPRTCITRATSRPSRASRSRAASGASSSAARTSSVTASFVGRRGQGRFVERHLG